MWEKLLTSLRSSSVIREAEIGSVPASGAFDLGGQVSVLKYLRQPLDVICAPEHAEQKGELMLVALTPMSSLVGIGTGFAHGGSWFWDTLYNTFTALLSLFRTFGEMILKDQGRTVPQALNKVSHAARRNAHHGGRSLEIGKEQSHSVLSQSHGTAEHAQWEELREKGLNLKPGANLRC